MMRKLRAVQWVADMGAIAAAIVVVMHDMPRWLAGCLAFAAFLCGIVSGRLHEHMHRNVVARRDPQDDGEDAWRARHEAAMDGAAARTQRHHAAVDKWARAILDREGKP